MYLLIINVKVDNWRHIYRLLNQHLGVNQYLGIWSISLGFHKFALKWSKNLQNKRKMVRTMTNNITTSKGSAQHPFPGQNKQYTRSIYRALWLTAVGSDSSLYHFVLFLSNFLIHLKRKRSKFKGQGNKQRLLFYWWNQNFKKTLKKFEITQICNNFLLAKVQTTN